MRELINKILYWLTKRKMEKFTDFVNNGYLAYKCNKCSSTDVKIHVTVSMTILPEQVRRLSKMSLRKAGCEIDWANWDKGYLVCGNCGMFERNIPL